MDHFYTNKGEFAPMSVDNLQPAALANASMLTQPCLPPCPRAKEDQIQENLIAYYRLFAGLPGVTFVEQDVTWVASTGVPGNQILRTRLPEQLDPSPLDQRIDELIRQIGQSTDAMDWFVFPSCQPIGLGERVAVRGLAGGPDGAWTLVGQIGGPGGNWMLADLTALVPAPAVDEQFHIKFVDNPVMLEAWRQISAEGFGGGEYQNFYAAYARHGFGPDAFSLHYIGYLGETPVTSSTLLLAGGIAGIFDVSTPIACRHQGFGSAISWAMLQEAQRRGYADAFVWSSNMGKGVYPRAGFVPVELGLREYQWQKR